MSIPFRNKIISKMCLGWSSRLCRQTRKPAILPMPRQGCGRTIQMVLSRHLTRLKNVCDVETYYTENQSTTSTTYSDPCMTAAIWKRNYMTRTNKEAEFHRYIFTTTVECPDLSTRTFHRCTPELNPRVARTALHFFRPLLVTVRFDFVNRRFGPHPSTSSMN